VHFQIFFAGKQSNSGSCLRSVGLADFVDDATEVQTVIDGVPGLLVGWGEGIGYDAAKQRWIDSGQAYRIGFWIDKPCVPKDLERRSLFAGYSIRLSDGNHWQIPAAAELPATLRLLDGHWKTCRKPQFDHFWTQSERWFRYYMLQAFDEKAILAESGMDPQQLRDDWAEFAVFCLRQNYRITPLIASELGLIDTENMLMITTAAVDGMQIDEVLREFETLKEREQAGLEKKSGST